MSLSTKPVIVVVGSLHYDIMVDAPDRPRKGETVAGYAWRPKFGGKGGNQAVAAARAGANVRMAGAVGKDDFGRYILSTLLAAGVDGSWIEQLSDVGSGMSVAISDEGGDYGAVIVSGANLHSSTESIADQKLWQDARILILQNEMPETINIVAATAARAAGAMVCVNAAPYRPMSEAFLALIDVLIVNAIEAEQLSSIPVSDLVSAATAAQALSRKFPTVVVTAGGDGVVGIHQAESVISLPGLPVMLVSTHGAGDVFVGSLATAIASQQPFSQSLMAANQAAAVHVSTSRE